MIPKIIHYCWFGGNPKPKLVEKCMQSWKKYCPDYEMNEWNEERFDISSAPLYVRQAYEAKKWAFVTDYVRLQALKKYGGIYLDTDVEIVKPLDKFLINQAFAGFEDGELIATCVLAAEKEFPLFDDLIHHYDNISFYRDDGSFNLTTNVETITDYCLKRGLVQNNQFQIVAGLALYPNYYFSPRSFYTDRIKRTRETVSIHWFSGSWHSQEEKEDLENWKKRNRQKERKDRIRVPLENNVVKVKSIVKKVIGHENYNRLKRLFRRI